MHKHNSFVPTEVELMASNETTFLSNNCLSTKWARTLKFEKEVLK
jgi:hypothetical protein